MERYKKTSHTLIFYICHIVGKITDKLENTNKKKNAPEDLKRLLYICNKECNFLALNNLETV